MTDQRSREHQDWGTWLERLEQQLQAMRTPGQETSPGDVWTDLNERLWAALAEAPTGASTDLLAQMRAALANWQDRLHRAAPPVEAFVETGRHLLALRDLALPFMANIAASTPQTRLPRLGPMQREQAMIDSLHAAVATYREVALRLAHEMTSLADECLEAFERELAARPCEEQLDPRRFMELWAETAEARYEAYVSTDGYARALGELTNAWAELNSRFQAVLDESLGALGLPTRRALDDTQLHLDRLRRRQRRETQALRAELGELRRAVDALDHRSAGSGGG